MPSLQTVDFQHNHLNDPAIVEILAQMPDLRVVYLLGNPVVKEIKHYRKAIISKCPSLKYLDDRPIFDEERRRVTAWAKMFETQGLDAANEAERVEIKLIKREKDELDERNFKAFEELMRRGQEIRRNREAAVDMCDDASIEEKSSPEDSDVNIFSQERIIDVAESEIVTEARKSRWGCNNSKSDADSWVKLKIEEGDSVASEPDTVQLSNDEIQEGTTQSKFFTLLSEAQADVRSQQIDHIKLTQTAAVQDTDLMSLD